MTCRVSLDLKILALLAIICLGLCACGDKPEATGDVNDEGPTGRRVNVSRVTSMSIKGHMEYVGVLEAFRKVNVASELGGTIETLSFEKGALVEDGQLLAEVGSSRFAIEVRQAEAALKAAGSTLEKTQTGSRPEEIIIAEAALQEAQAGLVEAEKNFKRARDLNEDRAVSESEYDAARKAVDMCRARVESASQQLDLARQGPRAEDRKTAQAHFEQAKAALALAAHNLKRSRVRAPSGGICAFRDVEKGEVIPAGTVLTQVVDLTHLKVKASVSEKDLPLVKAQKDFVFFVDAVSGEEFSCTLMFLSPSADPGTRSFPVEFAVKEPDERMADGMTVRVRLPVVNQKRTVKIPSGWLSEEDGEIGVYVINGDKARFVNIMLGAYYDQRVEILAGVNEGDLVITNPSGLKNGDAVLY